MKRSNLMFLACIMFFIAGVIFTLLAWLNYVEGETPLEKQIIARIVIWSIPTIGCLVVAILFKIQENKKKKNNDED